MQTQENRVDYYISIYKGKFMSFPRGNSAKRIIKPSTSNKTIHYHSDGSGRDNYVV